MTARPTTDLELLEQALSRVTPSTLWGVQTEARELLDAIGDLGFHLAPDVSLPERAPSRGPRTSDTAAESIDNLNDRQWAVWWALDFYGPMTDEETAEHYRALRVPVDLGVAQHGDLLPPQTPQSIRTRRKELVRAGHVIDTGVTRPTKTGRQAIVWAAVGQASEVAA